MGKEVVMENREYLEALLQALKCKLRETETKRRVAMEACEAERAILGDLICSVENELEEEKK
jgi:hypothetical protein